MTRKLAKFGGTSTATRKKILKVAEVMSEGGIQYVVLSAPGSRYDDDIRVTKLLVRLAGERSDSAAARITINKIVGRYEEIYPGSADRVKQSLTERFESKLPEARYLAALKAFGEEWQARLFAEEIDGQFIDPLEFLVLGGSFDKARVTSETYERLARLRDEKATLVFPGFYGGIGGELATFTFGGSDKSGGVISRGLDVDVYENFTDGPLRVVHPKILAGTDIVREITRLEMRILSYSGMEIINPEAITPLEGTPIPVHIRGTNQFPEEGTYVVSDRLSKPGHPVVGIGYREDLVVYHNSAFGLNDSAGVVRRVLDAARYQNEEREDRSLQFAFSGVDDTSFVFDREELSGVNEVTRVKHRILDQVRRGHEGYLPEDAVRVIDDVGVIVVAGQGLSQRDIANTLLHLDDANIKVRAHQKGFNSPCLVLTVDRDRGYEAVSQIYDQFFKEAA